MSSNPTDLDPTTPTDAIARFDAAAAGAATAIAPAVVRIGQGGGRGCGLVVAPGAVVTNAHNLRGDTVTVTFADGRQSTGELAAADLDADLAVVLVDTGDAPVAPFADTPARLGQVVFAVSRTSSGDDRLSSGIVSGTARAFRGPRGRRIQGGVEHTAPLPRGSSGSPVVDAAGAVLGLNTHRLGDGFYLALPTDAELRQRIDQLAAGRTGARPRLGVGLQSPAVASALRRSVGLPERDGLLVRGVEADGPAARAGIVAGDLLVTADGEALTSVDVLFDHLEAGRTELVVVVVRGVEEHTITVPLVDP